MVDLIAFSKQIRLATLKLVYEAKASHIGGAFSMADILSVLYNVVLNIDPKQADWNERDRFILSKGHACTSLYTTLALKGFFDKQLLSEYAKDDSILLSHTSHKVPGVELSTGSLGHALSFGCGLALAAKRKKESWKTVVLVSDGELDEGSNWEAILFAPHHQLNNLILVVDYNQIQSFGTVNEVLNLHPLNKKFDAFNWNVIEVDGHNHEVLEQAFKKAWINNKLPTVVIAHTIKGKGVDFMENQLLWHYKSPSMEQYEAGVKQIEAI